MKGRRAAIVLGMFVGALGTQGLSAGDNDRAVPRGGGGGGGGGGSHGGGSAAVSRHPSSGGGGGSSHSGGSSYSGGSSHSSSRGPQTGAQRRQPVPGQGHYGHGHGGGYYGRGHGYYGGYYGGYYPYYYWPYWGWGYAGYYSPWYYPYGGFYAGFGYPYYGGGYLGFSYSGGGGGGYYGGASYDASGSVRLLVEPVETKVYVDGYYAGKVDDFDGMFQRLNLRPGAHDITLKLDGYETHKVKLYVPLDHTLKVRHDMARGAADQVSEQTVGDPADAERYARRERETETGYDRPDVEEEREPRMRIEEGERRPDDRWSQGRERGTLRLDVTPVDASIYVDGMFRGTGQDLRRLNLPPGRHRLEVVRPGYRTLERDVEVQAGETEQVQVDLPRS